MATSRETYVGIDVSKDRLDVAVVNPARVRQFARACSLLAKTDKLDARVLAEFGRKVQPRRYTGKSEAGKQLSALRVRRRQLEEMLNAEQNRLRTTSPSLKSSVERMLVCLKQEKKILDEQIQQCVCENSSAFSTPCCDTGSPFALAP